MVGGVQKAFPACVRSVYCKIKQRYGSTIPEPLSPT